MQRRGAVSFVLPSLLLAAVTVWSVILAEGLPGLKPFMNLEAVLTVLGGTAACLAVAYPPAEVWDAVWSSILGRPADGEEAERSGSILRFGADCAMGMGGVATLLGTILMLASIEDVSAVPRRMALSLAAGFYGLVLSEAFFMPLCRRILRRPPGHRLVLVDTGARRFLVALVVIGGGLMQFFIILYALSAALNKG